MEIILHEEAFSELREAFITAGALVDGDEMRDAESFVVQDIIYKLWKYEPTAEDIARREAFLATPFGKIMSDMISRSNKYFVTEMVSWDAANAIMDGMQWYDKQIGATLKIRLPSDYAGSN